MKWLDNLWEGKIRAGFEMLVNMFSAGIWGFAMAIVGFYPIAWVVDRIMEALGGAVNWLVETNLLPLTSIIIEPAKVFFLNNAINHGVLTPLGLQEASDTGSSILFLLEANPGPGVGLLLAFTIFGIGAARASAPGAAVIQFFGGIHEVYFPYALIKPILIVALIAGGMTGVTTNMLLGGALRAPAAPGSIFAVIAQVAHNAYFAVILSVVLSATVTFLIAGSSSVPRASATWRRWRPPTTRSARRSRRPRRRRARVRRPREPARRSGDPGGRSGRRRDGDGAGDQERRVRVRCRNGLVGDGRERPAEQVQEGGDRGRHGRQQGDREPRPSADLVITQNQLTDRARQQTPDAVHVSVDNFMNSPRYDEVVDLVKGQHETQA